MRCPLLIPLCFLLFLCTGASPLAAQEQVTEPEDTNSVVEEEVEEEIQEALEDDQTLSSKEISNIVEEASGGGRQDEAALNEDPEAQRRSKIEEVPQLRSLWPKIEFYGSVRLHAINNFNEENEFTEFNLGDGASRLGLRGEWQANEKWWLFGRLESGFDLLETFTPKAGDEDTDRFGLRSRLYYGGFDSDNLTMVYGKNWSAYYRIAGMADRFSIFGGNGVGVYNARTDGGPTGMGRADDVLQARIYTSSLSALRIKPFNLNLQYQNGQPIPHVEGVNYDRAYGGSTWLETQGDRGMGVAYQRSELDEENVMVKEAGIDGDAQAMAVAFRSFGENWYAALVVARLDNIETTDQLQYINGYGAELYIQWQFKDRWWFISGGNWLEPDSDDPQAGEYNVRYAVFGLRYTLDSFRRMVYLEYRLDRGHLWDGTPRRDELTLGVRWDFGH